MKDELKIEDQYDLDEEEKVMVQVARLLFRLSNGEDYLSKEVALLFMDKNTGLKYRNKKILLDIGSKLLKSAAVMYYIRTTLEGMPVDPKVDN